MNESTKTLSLIAIAAGLLLVAFVTRPRLPYAEPEGDAKQMFPDLKNAADVKSVEINTFDDTLLELEKFKVAEVDGRWIVPSHANFPVMADDQAASGAGAGEHVVKAATALINLPILEKISDAPGDHETYGVVELDPTKLEVVSGVGKLVVLRDAAEKPLARLIIGKPATAPSGGESANANLRYVRRAGEDAVYVVDLNSDLFSTKFADWIDPDLLQIKEHWNITKMQLRNYTVGRDQNEFVVDRKNDLTLDYNDQKSAWSVANMTIYKDNKPTEIKLGRDDEIDTAKLNDMKQSLAGIKIIDVEPKPPTLAADLKKQKSFFANPEGLQALRDDGFIPLPADKPTDIFSAGDDMTVQMKDGVEYAVRFGGVAFGGKDENKDTKKKGAAGKSDKKSTIQRMVFVTARFNEGAVPKPELEPLPTEKKPEAGKAEAGKTETGKTDAGKGDAGKAAEPKKHAAPDVGKKSDKGSASLNGTSSTTAMPSANDPPAAGKAAPAKTDEKKTDEKKTDDKKTEPKAPSDAKAGDAKAGDKTGDGQKPASGIKQADQEQARDAERKRIEAANKTKTDAYNESIKKGKEHAKQLNDRFAGYFFLISEDDYKKVHLGRNEIIKRKLGAGLENPFEKPATPPGGLIPGGLK